MYRCLFVFGLWSLVFGATSADASVTLNVSASNPSAFQEQTLTVKSYSPKGIRPENVLDAGGLEIGYDVKRDSVTRTRKLSCLRKNR